MKQIQVLSAVIVCLSAYASVLVGSYTKDQLCLIAKGELIAEPGRIFGPVVTEERIDKKSTLKKQLQSLKPGKVTQLHALTKEQAFAPNGKVALSLSALVDHQVESRCTSPVPADA